MQYKANIGNDANDILAVAIVQFNGLIIASSHQHFGACTFAEQLLLLVECIADSDGILLQDKFVEQWQIGGIVTNGVFHQQDGAYAFLKDIVLGIQAILYQFNDCNDEVRRVVPVEQIIDVRFILLINTAVNLFAEYDVETIDSNDDMLVIKVTSGAYNGITTFDNGMPACYTVKTDSKSEGNCFSAELVSYNKTGAASENQWQSVSEKGISIKAGESICLRYKLSPLDEDDVDVSDVQSILFMDETDFGGAKYYGSGSGSTIMTLNLMDGKGRAYCDWDY